MPLLSIILGAALLLLGIVGYVLTDMVSWTALIPACFGLPIGLLGLAALEPAWRKHTMHAAAALALLGLLGSVTGIPKVVSLLAGNDVERPGAAVSQTIMAALCLLFVAMAFRSFLAARRARNQPAQPSA
jgi:hypothetical protein